MTTSLDGTAAHHWITQFTRVFDHAQQGLTELDRLAGDGDFGTNIASALRRVNAALPVVEDATYRNVFTAASQGFLATGGTSGPLFGMWSAISPALERTKQPCRNSPTVLPRDSKRSKNSAAQRSVTTR